MRAALLICTALLVMSPKAVRADLVVIPVSTDDATTSSQATLRAEIEQELAARRMTYLPAREAATKVAKESHEWRRTPAEELKTYRTLMSQVLGGKFQRKRAVTAVDELLKMMLDTPEIYAVEDVHSEVSAHSEVHAACLVGVRSALALQRDDDARWLAQRCMVLLNLAVTDHAVAPDLRSFFGEVDEQLRQQETVEILVKSAPEGCTAFLNGQAVNSPEARKRHDNSALHWVYVECRSGRRSRVHTPQLPSAGTLIVDVNVDFDQALHTDTDGVALRYERAPRPEVLRSDLDRMTRVLRVDQALAVAREGAHWILTLSGSSQTATLPAAYGPAELNAALEALVPSQRSARTETRTGNPDAAAENETAYDVEAQTPSATDRPQSSSSKRPRRWQPLVCGAVLTLGAASFITAGILLRNRHEDGEQIRQNNARGALSLSDLEHWDRERTAPYVFGALGATALTSGATAMILSFDSTPPPVVGLVAGLAGVGLAAWGISDIARGGACDGSSPRVVACSGEQEQRDRGAVVTMSAAPFLAVALTQWLLDAHIEQPSDAHQRTLSVTPALGFQQISLQTRGAW